MTKHVDRLRVDLLRLAAGRAGLLLEEVIHEQRHVFEPIAQRRNFHRDDSEPVIKILAERAVLHLRLQRFVRRADHAHIDRRALVVAHAPHFALLQHAQQLRLQRSRHRVHFIEENRPEVRLFEKPALVRHRAGERALLVPEQFRLEQVLRAARCN